jgi:hypothetical protein
MHGAHSNAYSNAPFLKFPKTAVMSFIFSSFFWMRRTMNSHISRRVSREQHFVLVPVEWMNNECLDEGNVTSHNVACRSALERDNHESTSSIVL